MDNKCSIMIFIVCFIGLIAQINDIGQRFFEYKTRTSIEMKIPDKISVPSLSVCWAVSESVNIVKMSKDFNLPHLKTHRNFWKHSDWNPFYQLLDSLTVRQLFKYSPETHEILRKDVGCMIRFPSEHALRSPNPDGKHCLDHFKITKYFHRGLICFKFIPNFSPSDGLNLNEYTLSPNSPGLIYKFYFNKEVFGDVHYFTSYAHSFNTSHFHDSLFSSMKFFSRNSNSSSDSFANIDVTYNQLTLSRMKSPYDTDCIDYYPHASGMEFFLENVKNETLKEIDRVITQPHIYREHLENKFLSTSELRNQSISGKLNAIIDQHKLQHSDCDVMYYLSKMDVTKGRRVSIGINWPQDSEIIIKHVPQQELTDLILYVCSSFGIWFGLSVMTLFRYLQRLISFAKDKTANNELSMVKESRFHDAQRIKALELRLQMLHNYTYSKLSPQVGSFVTGSKS